jgi:hypothetical protein
MTLKSNGLFGLIESGSRIPAALKAYFHIKKSNEGINKERQVFLVLALL